jgi:hypothetical protein
MQPGSLGTAAALLASIAPVKAVPPPNDDVAAAVAFATVPFAQTMDTAEATNGPDDPSPRCHGGATVWYRFTPSVDQSILVSTAGSDYDTFVSVYAGSPRAPVPIRCAVMETALFQARARTSYFIVVSAPAGEPGGHLVFGVRPSPFTMSIDPTGTLDPTTGAATVRARLTCREPVAISLSRLALSQRAGDRVIRSVADQAGLTVCDPAEPLEVLATVADSKGGYRGGRAWATADLGLALGGSVGEVRARGGVILR